MTELDHRSIDWAIEIISMCEPVRCVQGGMWFGRNHSFADATFVDYGAADAFAVAAKELPRLVDLVRTLLDNDPEELVADGGIRVIDVWRQRARQVLDAGLPTAADVRGILSPVGEVRKP